MKCILTNDDATRFECFSGIATDKFDILMPKAPTRKWLKVCPQSIQPWKGGFYIAQSSIIRAWCEDCYNLIQREDGNVPEKIPRALGTTLSSRQELRKEIRKRFGFSISKNVTIVSLLAEKYPSFSQTGLFSAAFIAIALAKTKGLITSNDIIVKKTKTGLFIQEIKDTVALSVQKVFDRIPEFDERMMIDFVCRKTDWSLKYENESYSLDEIEEQYYLGMGEV